MSAAAPTPSSTPRFRPSYKTCKEISARCAVKYTTYGYVPILAPNALYTAWFALLALLALGFGIKSRTWTYTLALFTGTALEALGYGGRLMMTPNPWNDAGFKMQICCLVLAPSALAACIYLTLKHLVNFYGPEHSILKPRLYPWIFVGCDIGSMCVQAIGGGVAASASQRLSLVNVGNRLIVAGIAIQVATMVLCGLLMAIFIFRYRKAKKNGGDSSGSEKNEYFAENPRERKRLHIFCYSVAVAYTVILIRCIYRIPEMAGGWGNPLMQNEKEFLILDGAMIAIGSACLTIVHPAFFFKAFTKHRSF